MLNMDLHPNGWGGREGAGGGGLASSSRLGALASSPPLPRRGGSPPRALASSPTPRLYHRGWERVWHALLLTEGTARPRLLCAHERCLADFVNLTISRPPSPSQSKIFHDKSDEKSGSWAHGKRGCPVRSTRVPLTCSGRPLANNEGRGSRPNGHHRSSPPGGRWW